MVEEILRLIWIGFYNVVQLAFGVGLVVDSILFFMFIGLNLADIYDAFNYKTGSFWRSKRQGYEHKWYHHLDMDNVKSLFYLMPGFILACYFIGWMVVYGK